MLLKLASQAGNKNSNGLGMLIEQAALAFQLWTGKNVKTEIMWKALNLHLATINQEK